MKQKDIATIIIVVAVSAIVSYVISNKIFVTPKDRAQTVEVVPAISSEFPQPDPKYFNSQAFDPTQLIQIGNNNNTNPFGSTSQ